MQQVPRPPTLVYEGKSTATPPGQPEPILILVD